ncbi:MAG: peptidoglycan-binding protein [Bryobacteraceae bacterium]
MTVLKIGCNGQGVLNVQCALASAGVYSGNFDGCFGPQTAAAVTAFQNQKGLPATGIVDDATAAALNVQDTTAACLVPELNAEMVAPMFPDTPVENIEANLPYVLNALVAAGLGDQQMILMALATIRAETGSFLPISEGVSHFNTSPGGHPFDLYDNRADLGNQGAPDGANFRGRGFIQLTGRTNFNVHGQAIGVGDQLISDPFMAHDPTIAAKLMASFLKAHESDIRAALANNDLREARRLVNGGSNGLEEFTEAYNTGSGVIPQQIAIPTSTNNASS